MNGSVIIGGKRIEGERVENDFYPTPEYVTEELLKREGFDGVIWEPACGTGSMSEPIKKAGYTVESSDLIDRGYGCIGVDFLQTNSFADNIITNPPYKYATEFVEKAIKTTGKKVAMLLKLQFLEGMKRKQLFAKYPPKIVYVFSKRICFSEGKSPLMVHCWFVWEKGYKGETKLEWI